MKRFLYRLFLFLSPLIFGFLGFILVNIHYVAAPKISNSYSLNEKLYRAPHTPLDVLAIGSSMTQANLESETLVHGLGDVSYFNFANWGFSIKDIRNFAGLVTELYRPSRVIIVSNVIDFRNAELEYDVSRIKKYLRSPFRPAWNLRYFDMKYLLERTMDNRENLRRTDIYSSLCFDSWGGVSYSTEDFKIRRHRWNNGVHFDLLDEQAYHDLEEVCRILQEKSVQPVFVLSPLRDGLVDDHYRMAIQAHAERVQKIIADANGVFLDTTKFSWPDHLFVDGTHLNQAGGRRLSQMLVERLKEAE